MRFPYTGLQWIGRRRRAPRRRLVAALVATAACGVPAPAAAQVSELAGICRDQTDGEALRFCNLVAQAIEVGQPVLGLAPTGGNPVPGTASTLGMRIGTLPRVSIGGRFTAVWMDLPPIRVRGATREIGLFLPAVNVDGALGLFAGFSPAATVGGVGSVDVLASVGLVPLPGGDGFTDDLPLTWAAGLRLGLLRESFTAPGLSVSGTYRKLGTATFGDPALQASDAFFSTDPSLLSLRGAIGKRMAGIGLTAGAGYDRYSSDVEFGIADGALGLPGPSRFRLDDFDNDRFSAFLNASLTFLVLHAVAELGWQQAGERVPGELPAGIDFDPESAIFGSLAIRLSI